MFVLHLVTRLLDRCNVLVIFFLKDRDFRWGFDFDLIKLGLFQWRERRLLLGAVELVQRKRLLVMELEPLLDLIDGSGRPSLAGLRSVVSDMLHWANFACVLFITTPLALIPRNSFLSLLISVATGSASYRMRVNTGTVRIHSCFTITTHVFHLHWLSCCSIFFLLPPAILPQPELLGLLAGGELLQFTVNHGTHERLKTRVHERFERSLGQRMLLWLIVWLVAHGIILWLGSIFIARL